MLEQTLRCWSYTKGEMQNAVEYVWKEEGKMCPVSRLAVAEGEPETFSEFSGLGMRRVWRKEWKERDYAGGGG